MSGLAILYGCDGSDVNEILPEPVDLLVLVFVADDVDVTCGGICVASRRASLIWLLIEFDYALLTGSRRQRHVKANDEDSGT